MGFYGSISTAETLPSKQVSGGSIPPVPILTACFSSFVNLALRFIYLNLVVEGLTANKFRRHFGLYTIYKWQTLLLHIQLLELLVGFLAPITRTSVLFILFWVPFLVDLVPVDLSLFVENLEVLVHKSLQVITNSTTLLSLHTLFLESFSELDQSLLAALVTDSFLLELERLIERFLVETTFRFGFCHLLFFYSSLLHLLRAVPELVELSTHLSQVSKHTLVRLLT